MTDAHKVQTSLRAILHKFNAPLDAFDEIQKWAHESARLVKYNFADQKLPSLQSYTQSVFQRFNLHGIKPKLISLTLPVEHRKVDIVIHDVRQMVYSMLNNPSHWKMIIFCLRQTTPSRHLPSPVLSWATSILVQLTGRPKRR